MRKKGGTNNINSPIHVLRAARGRRGTGTVVPHIHKEKSVDTSYDGYLENAGEALFDVDFAGDASVDEIPVQNYLAQTFVTKATISIALQYQYTPEYYQ